MIELGLSEFGACLMIFTVATNLRTYRFQLLAAHAGTHLITSWHMSMMCTSAADR